MQLQLMLAGDCDVEYLHSTMFVPSFQTGCGQPHNFLKMVEGGS